LTYVGQEIGLDRAFAVMRLLVPDFVEMRGCVLRRESYAPENLEHWWTTLDGDVSAIEEMINHVHLWDVFLGLSHSPLEDRALAEFGTSMALTWEAALLQRFPERRFVVEFLAEPESHYGPTVSFHSLRDGIQLAPNPAET
jgi:hypothetical protein